MRKYDADGNELWTSQFGTTLANQAQGVAIDDSGNVLVAGWTGGILGGASAGGVDAFVRKYDPDGNQLWTRQFGSSGSDLAQGVAVDNSGNVLVAGHTNDELEGASAGSNDAYVRKYDTAGNQLWTRQFGTSGSDFANDVAIDDSHNALVAGSTAGDLEGSSAGITDAFIRVYGQ